MRSEKLNFTGELCSVNLFRNVKNPLEIREKLMKGQLDATVINAKLIPDILQIFVAANKAAKSRQNGKALTKTVHTELIYNLSPTKKVTESLKIFGISEKSQDLLVVTFDDDNGEKLQNIKNVIQGDIKDLAELPDITDWNEIAQLHGIIEAKLDPEHIRDLLISKSAVKDFLL